ncbi:uncharacterized protein LOC118502461 [Anopheles stephensi]|uniref:uncharacterized protein LOC118502461 n=1 Tax=Anopheles stephensi TaxID=30069 RepID=UPI001658A574|nr:uncharacterized protein LOC118502461 [Anopheles stephensi]
MSAVIPLSRTGLLTCNLGTVRASTASTFLPIYHTPAFHYERYVEMSPGFVKLLSVSVGIIEHDIMSYILARLGRTRIDIVRAQNGGKVIWKQRYLTADAACPVEKMLASKFATKRAGGKVLFFFALHLNGNPYMNDSERISLR